MKGFVKSVLFAVMSLSALMLSNEVSAVGNQNMQCSGKFYSNRFIIEPTKGDFIFADKDDLGVGKIRYGQDGKLVDGLLIRSNSTGGSTGKEYYLCSVKQAKNVGTASTLLFVFSENSSCTNWGPWVQLQSAHVYSSCSISGQKIVLK